MRYVLFFLIFLFGSTSVAYALDEVALVRTMQAIGNDWRKFVANGSRLLVSCGNESWSTRHFYKESEVSFDLRKTQSLIVPYKAEVIIKGWIIGNMFSDEANANKDKNSSGRDMCFKTKYQAFENRVKIPQG